MGNDTGVQASGTENDQICLSDLLLNLLLNLNIVIIGQTADIPDIPADSLFSKVFLSRALSYKIYLLSCQRKYRSFDIKELTHIFGCLCQIPLKINQCCQYDVSDRMCI